MQEMLGRKAGSAPSGERVLSSLLPFAAAAGLAALITPVATKVDWPLYAAALTVGVLAGLIRLAPLPGALGRAREVVPSMIFLTGVALLRGSAGGVNSGVGMVALLPVFWTALHGDRRQLCAVVFGVALFFFAPLLLVGSPEYPSTQYRAGVLFLAVSAIVGLTTQWLVAEVRSQAKEAERREHALEQVAATMRGLSSSGQARTEVCEAARSIGEASFAFLYEPVGVGQALRATATSDIEMQPLEIDPAQKSVAREAFVSRRSCLWSAESPSEALNPDLWESVGRPASLLFEPVSRGEEPVGVLVVGWNETIRPGGTRATLIALLAHEVAATIERGDVLAQMTDMASTDALTGLPNRWAWEIRLREALLNPGRLMLAMLDLDHFKAYNDTNGHPAGDRLLRETASAWREELRTGDFLARVGGEEFALLLPMNEGDALTVVERLRRRVPYDQTCSAGVVTRRFGESTDSLIARADEALYAAKADGRDRVAVVA